jgi:hypothetical protein
MDDIEYIDEQELNPVSIDDGYYSLPEKPKPQYIAQSRITLQDYERVSKNTSPAKARMIEVPTLAQIQAKYPKKT